MDKTQELVDVFKALACDVRLKIVRGLCTNKGCTVCKMAEKLGISQPNVSQHLNILKKAGVITGERKGNEICYKVTNPMVVEFVKVMEQSIKE